jgi:hypothetical protein
MIGTHSRSRNQEPHELTIDVLFRGKVTPVSRVGGQLAAVRPQGRDLLHVFYIDDSGVLRCVVEEPAAATATATWRAVPLPQADGLPFSTDYHPAGAGATGHQRRGERFDVFTVDRDGMLRIYAADGRSGWRSDVVPDALGIPPGSGLVTGYQDGGGRLGVFSAGRAGELLCFSGSDDERWRRLQLPLGGTLPHGANLATAYLAERTRLAVFAVDRDGAFQVLVEEAGGAWKPHSPPEARLPAGAPLATGYRKLGADPSVFVVDDQGDLREFQFDGRTWRSQVLPGGGLTSPASVATGYQDNQHLLVFVVDEVGRLRQYASQSNGSWSVGIVPGGNGLPPGTPLATGYRQNGAVLEVFALPHKPGAPIHYSGFGGGWTGPHYF